MKLYKNNLTNESFSYNQYLTLKLWATFYAIVNIFLLKLTFGSILWRGAGACGGKVGEKEMEMCS